MMNRKALWMVLWMALGVLGLAGCEQEGPAERAGEQVDEATEQMGQQAEEMGDKAEEATER